MISTGQIVCTSSPQQIDGTSENPFKIVLHNASASDSIYIGNSNVTGSTGFDLHSKSTLTLDLPPLSALYVIATNGSPTINWMRISD
jgi:hypothetical protein